MNPPSDFFLGIADFFGSLLPGLVLLSGIGFIAVNSSGTTPCYESLEGWLPYLAVGGLLASYLVGQLISVFASGLDPTYDAIRQLRWPKQNDKAFLVAKQLQRTDLGADADCMSTYQWCRSFLIATGSSAYSEVERLEATQKLFRSLVVVGLALSAFAAYSGDLAVSVGVFGSAVLGFLPYVDRRYKTTETAYRLVIARKAAEKNAK